MERSQNKLFTMLLPIRLHKKIKSEAEKLGISMKAWIITKLEGRL